MFNGKQRRFKRRPTSRGHPSHGTNQTGMRSNSFSNGHSRNNFRTALSAEKLLEKYNTLAKEALSSDDKTLSEKARILLTYDMLRGFTKFKRAKPCLKRYLTTRMKTQFIPVLPDEWGPAIFLPLENFKKKSKAGVWQDSKEIYSAIRQ
jgi:hypothetical protein